ncbi:MAG TPA: MBOAT family O-acyltransferase [Xanthobacteraceae bacterium]|nr:MBOAT family O-acyltransferase [Xanthobacteraceae bacterium]
MLFNSYIFILLFLPATLFIFHALRTSGRHRMATAALAFASLVFYGWWSLQALLLLLILMAANYAVVWRLLRSAAGAARLRLALVVTGVAGNLLVLGYFKCSNFFLENWSALFGTEVDFVAVVLPLGLSFFTFQKIALLVDAYEGRVRHFDLLGYILFVTFFPQLIAGPIVHHSEVMPQFALSDSMRKKDFAQGLVLFVIGLSKKVLVADTIAQLVGPAFDAAAVGKLPSIVQAWTAALAYTLQLYFDFSGYSDMAIGLALLFGIRLPANFNSPYKALNIIEFWRQWHMTLSRFLRDYLYVPLGGNRRGEVRRYLNLLVTMVLGGLWHGAAWTFVLWGALHGIFLVINHLWIALRPQIGLIGPSNFFTRFVSRTITFVAVVTAWVFFRAADLNSAVLMLRAMAGNGGHVEATMDAAYGLEMITALLAIVWFAPNSLELTAYAFAKKQAALNRIRFEGPMSPHWAIVCGLLLAFCLMSLTQVSEFLYFQF